MKKVTSINLSGRLITIDDDALTQLQVYIAKLKTHFSNEQGADEIIADIENRIAEIFYDKQQKGQTSIVTTDVTNVEKAIGNPEDFDNEGDTSANTSAKNNPNTASAEGTKYVNRGRLSRNENDKMLGGVCSGVAAYLNIDTVLVRVIFALLLFGAGMGFLLYIILWIVLPKSATVQSNPASRLYRNPDDKMLGGVASGLAQYFRIEVWIPRILFALPFIFSFFRGFSSIAFHNIFEDNRFWNFSFGGTTTVVYFLLWWIIPEAKNAQQKMAMKGEKLDLNSIKNNVQSELNNIADRVNAWGDRVNAKTPQYTANATAIARTTGQRIGSGIGLLIKGFVFFIVGLIAFTLLMSIVSLLVAGAGVWPLKAFVFEGFWQNSYALGSILFFIVPAVAIVLYLTRKVFKLQQYARPVNVTLGILFFVGLVSAVLLTGSMLSSFQFHNNRLPATEVVMPQPTKPLVITVNQPELLYSGELSGIHFGNDNNDDTNGFDINKDSLKLSNIKILIERSSDSAYHTLVKKYSRGRSRAEAEARAQKLSFAISNIPNTVDVASYIGIGKAEKYRGQEALVIVQVPVGKQVIFDATVDKLNTFNIRISGHDDSNNRRKYRNKENTYYNNDYHFDYQVNQAYCMTAEGDLKLINQPASYKNNAENNYDNNQPSKKQLQRDSIIQKLERQKDSLDNAPQVSTTEMRMLTPFCFIGLV